VVAGAGLRLLAGAGGSTISGLVINGFAFAIRLVESHENMIYGCLLGLDATGTTAVGAQRAGVVLLGGQRNRIGAPGRGNIITANSFNGTDPIGIGISFQGESNNNTVQANYIGTDQDGSVAVGQLFSGIQMAFGATGNMIGGSGPGEGNVLAN